MKPVLTDNGLEIRTDAGDVIWGPSETYSWPPNEEMMDAIVAEANISQPMKDVLQISVGNIDMMDETTTEDQ